MLADASNLYHSASAALRTESAQLGLVCSVDASNYDFKQTPAKWHTSVHLAVGPVDARGEPLVVSAQLAPGHPEYLGMRVAADSPLLAGPVHLLLARHRNNGLRELLLNFAKVLLIVTVADLFRSNGPDVVWLERIPGTREPDGTVRFTGHAIHAVCVPLRRTDLEAALLRAATIVSASQAKLAALQPSLSRTEFISVEGWRHQVRRDLALAASLVGWDDPRLQRWLGNLASIETTLRQRLAQALETPPAPRGSGRLSLLSVHGVRSACGPGRTVGPLPKSFHPKKDSCVIRFTLHNGSLNPFSLTEIRFVSELGVLIESELYQVGGKAALHSPSLGASQSAEYIAELTSPRDLESEPLRAPIYLMHTYQEVMVKLSEPAWHQVAPGYALRVERLSCGDSKNRALLEGDSMRWNRSYERPGVVPCFLFFELRRTAGESGLPFASLHLGPVQSKGTWFLEAVPVARLGSGVKQRPELTLAVGQSAHFAAYVEDQFGRITSAPDPEDLRLYFRLGDQHDLIRAEDGESAISVK